MKALINCLILLLSFTFSLPTFSQDYIIDVTSTGQQGLNAKFTLKGDKVLMETQTEDGKMKRIFDKSNGDIINLVEKDGKKMAIKMNINNSPQFRRMKQMEAKTQEKKEDVQITVVDENAEINGRQCVKVKGQDNRWKGMAWIDKNLKISFADLIPGGKRHAVKSSQLQKKFGLEGFPVRLEMTDLQTNEEWTMDSKITETEVSDDAFAVKEEEYGKIIDMTDMRQLMMEAQKDPAKFEQIKKLMMDSNIGN